MGAIAYIYICKDYLLQFTVLWKFSAKCIHNGTIYIENMGTMVLHGRLEAQPLSIHDLMEIFSQMHSCLTNIYNKYGYYGLHGRLQGLPPSLHDLMEISNKMHS